MHWIDLNAVAARRCLSAVGAALLTAGGAIAGFNACDADLDLDTEVNSADLNILLASFGADDGGDINGDGDTDSVDLNHMLAAFGAVDCPGDCCLPNGTPGCVVESCEALVCASDPFCCETSWDSLCRDAALLTCGVCDGCCESNGTPGCADDECQDDVCAIDPFCCDNQWDDICAGEAADLCAVCGGEPPIDCCETHATPGCNDADCEGLVCGLDPFCCDSQWDNACVGNALELCEGCGGDGPVPGACCFDNGSCVDVVTAFECSLVGGAYQGDQTDCDSAGCQPAFEGDCCEANGTPGCDDEACTALICAIDPFCCDNQWDGICADAAIEGCDVCAPPAPAVGACCFPIGGICIQTTQAQCLAGGGLFEGAGVPCSATPCNPL